MPWKKKKREDKHVWDVDDLYQLLGEDDQILGSVINSFTKNMPDELLKLEAANHE